MLHWIVVAAYETGWSLPRAPTTARQSLESPVSVEYSSHTVGSKLGTEPLSAALARRCKKSRLKSLSKLAAAAHAHSTQPANHLQRAEVLPTLPLAVQLEQPPLRANLPNP